MEILSTTQISKKYGLKAKPTVFQFLLEKKLIVRNNDRYELTNLGIANGGSYFKSEDGQWIIWDEEKFLNVLVLLKHKLIEENPNKIRLFHMTHLNNLSSILTSTLKCHNFSKDYLDISNKSVNSRREIIEPHFHNSLHDYVPFYLNPKNPMLFNVQKNYGDKIIILEYRDIAFINPYSLFTDKNAAVSDAKFFYSYEDFINNAPWDKIYSQSWNDDVTNEIKQRMMSECLIHEFLTNDFLIKIHCQNSNINKQILDTMKLTNFQYIDKVELITGSSLFF